MVFYVVTSLIWLVMIGMTLFAVIRWRELRAESVGLRTDVQELIVEKQEQAAEFERRLARFEKLAHIPDIQDRANRLKVQCDSALEKAKARADRIVNEAHQEAQEIIRRLTEDARENAASMSAALEMDKKWALDHVQAAEREAREMIRNAEQNVAGAATAAAATLEEARGRAREVVRAANGEANEKTRRAGLDIATAAAYSYELRERAEKRSAEIGGKAYEALKRHEYYESAAQALQNIVKGYGNQFSMPSSSLLDELAEEFGFAEAGQKLRWARERTKALESRRLASTCDYAEVSRREFAMSFVLDAFNGKVDSIIARLKDNNYRKLKQEVLDAFAAINLNGQAFKDARITDEYCDARLDELKWGEVVQQLKLRAREEQRAIKEQLRDEEKARREYERAIRQAKRDEAMLSNALEQARSQFEFAAVGERQRLESRIEGLVAKLQEAEERNRRAISMAQQTKCGHVYIISNIGSFGEEVYKIGLTRRLDPTERVRELGSASVPFGFDIHGMIYSEEAPALEADLHKQFLHAQLNKVNKRKEFFRVTLAEIREAVEKLGLTAKWTMAAEAKDYRETLALERAMDDDDSLRQRWLERQARLETEEQEELEEGQAEEEEPGELEESRAEEFDLVAED